jgi:hypothetical protein
MKPIRATINDVDGMLKYFIIKNSLDRFKQSINDGYFLEATSLIESLICDRLESRLGELTKSSVEFDTIANLVNKLCLIETDEKLLFISDNDIKNWSRNRNVVIHQSAKIEYGKNKDWNDFIKMAKKTALEGKAIFNRYNTQLKKLRR